MTYLLKLKRTRNGTTTEHTVFADGKPIMGEGGITIMFEDEPYFLTGVKCTEAAELRFSQERSMFNNKFLLEKLEAE